MEHTEQLYTVTELHSTQPLWKILPFMILSIDVIFVITRLLAYEMVLQLEGFESNLKRKQSHSFSSVTRAEILSTDSSRS